MFSFSGAKRRPDVTSPWKFGVSGLPRVIVGDAGSGKSELLLEIARQALVQSKAVFYFTLRSDLLAVNRFASSAAQAGMSDRCFVGSYMNGPTENTGLRIEALEPIEVVRQRGAACFAFCVLSRGPEETRQLVDEVIGRCASAILADAEIGAAVVLVEDTEFLSPETLNRLSDLSKHAEVIVSMSGGYAAKDSMLFAQGAGIITLKTTNRNWAYRIESSELCACLLASLKHGEGYQFEYGGSQVQSIKWSMRPVNTLKELRFANKRVEPASAVLLQFRGKTN